MKKSLLFFILLISAITSAQIPNRDDNIIMLITEKKPEDDFTQFGRYLIEKGYSFDITDKEFMMLKTSPKVSLNNRGKQSAVHHRFTITFNDSIIKIKPEIEILSFSGDMTWIEWQHRTSKSDFNYMNWYNNFKAIFEEYEGKTKLVYTHE